MINVQNVKLIIFHLQTQWMGEEERGRERGSRKEREKKVGKRRREWEIIERKGKRETE